MSGDRGRARPPDGPNAGMRVFGAVLLGCAALVAGRIATGNADGDWRSAVLWAGIGIPLALGGLLLNGRLVRLCVALAWTLPATFLFAGAVLLLDPAYATFLDGPRDWASAVWTARVLGILLLTVGYVGIGVYIYGVRRALADR